MSNPRIKQHTMVSATVVAGEAAVVTPGDSSLHILNRVGTVIWGLCEGDGKHLNELVVALLERFDVHPDIATAEVTAFVEQGAALGFLELEL
ncbi:MAG: hypothetical protein ACI81R_002624 [Bradymonadia bacterium]|jgi:hypothetical protein